MGRKILLGFTNDNEVVFGEAEITTRNGYKEFTACFSTVRPFEDEETDGVAYYEELLGDCYSDEQKYKLCEEYDCKPSELAETMAEDEGIEKLSETLDCSVYNNTIYVNGSEWAFESISGGPHDIMEDEDMIEFTNKELASHNGYC